MSEKVANSIISYRVVLDSVPSEGRVPGCVSSEGSLSHHADPWGGRRVSSTSVGASAMPLAQRAKRRDVSSEWEESQTAGEAGLEQHLDHWSSLYPEITSDGQQQEYKKQFDSKLMWYKHLQAEMDSLHQQIKDLSQELDTLPEESARYQAVAGEYNRMKSLWQMPEYQTKKLQCRELRQKLLHMKTLVRTYDRECC
ncbi:hypothetical protein SKAU_G00375870 [Synaphobranchus kaupii]|uniref:OCEL domain-containing protein n=1 Tax=Synaphobranchus kaupii TaxID=118154 RepID=A0A9Q1ECN2_SYNKA|nr:hypothetical protein SKAU_G00375870 [Synaphobranchus kaupii]